MPRTAADVNARLLEAFAAIGSALGHPQRIKLLTLLDQGPKTVEHLAGQTEQSVASASAHLKVLRTACLVSATRRGKYIVYRLAAPQVADLLAALKTLGARQLPAAREAVQSYFADAAEAATYGPRALLAAARAGEVTLLDVRPPDEFAAGHLPLARCLPAGELGRGMRDLPRDKPIIVCCRGPYCVTAVEAVRKLRSAGFDARRCDLGVTEWRAAGLHLEHPTEPAGDSVAAPAPERSHV